jgi:uncharacterized damage-inducible protein DinB
MDLNDYFDSTWAARGRLLAAAESLSPEEWAREFPFSWKSIRNLFAHVIEVEGSWIVEDILREPWERPSAEEVPSRYATVAATRARSEEVAAVTRRVLRDCVPGRLRETRRGTLVDGAPADFTVEQILTHVFTHELRHQGQIQAMLRLLGKPAPNADWI